MDKSTKVSNKYNTTECANSLSALPLQQQTWVESAVAKRIVILKNTMTVKTSKTGKADIFDEIGYSDLPSDSLRI